MDDDVKAVKIAQKMGVTYKDCRAWVSYPEMHLNRGNPLTLNTRHGGSTPHGGQDPVNIASMEAKLSKVE